MEAAIKLMRTPKACYFYDANKNSIIEISAAEHAFLQGAGKIDEASLDGFAHLKELYGQGYLHSLEVERVMNPMTPYLGDLLDRCLQKATLQLTQNCNFRCTYCTYTHSDGSQRTHADNRMTFETAKKAVDYLLAHSIDTPEVYIGFYGGEPLLEFPLIQKVVEYADGLFPRGKLRYTITTNASILNEEITAFLKGHRFSVVISLDGPERIHDKNRVFAESGKGTFGVVIKKLEEVYRKEPEFFKSLTLNMVIDPSNDFDEVLSLFAEYPFLQECMSQMSVIDDYFTDKKNVVSESYTESMEYQTFLGYLYLLNRIREEEVPAAVLGRIKGIEDDTYRKYQPKDGLGKTSAPGGPCVPGKSRLLVTYDGKLIPCERVSETSQALCLGSLETGIEVKKAEELLNVAALTAEACRKCWAFGLCSSCIKYADEYGELSAAKRLSYCESARANALHGLYEQLMLRECMG